ncbi:aspartate/glutamate racemase family protein [Pseudoduganella chitinolytica]|uniref:Aspartate/glutamate racemase family protein n=1 Tax=Pseudoduganella chitinolytica TaxID=34070 RepID=A0ABY8BEZ4_9BURK|nr:aspartate/glutamate racemase family protein [Pseudoduganella chitinolytica]WEF34485.1 aspartate/glutamate racemase family protein [Pseudoduganella chitinolytica]
MHIGLIGGIGPAATEFYYRALVKLYAKADRRLELTIANADAREMVSNLEAGNKEAQAAVFAKYIDQLKGAGCEAVAVTSMGGHFCMDELEPLSSLPIISALPALQAHFAARNITRVGVLGTRAVMESRLYGLAGVDVVTVPGEELGTAHANYVSMAVVGKATDEHRAYFEEAAGRLISEHRAQAIVLGGTDLFLAFDKPGYPYPVIDCALVHTEEIARLAMN